MDDNWEAFYGVNDPLGDPDNDGVSNLDEYLAGTHPNDAAPTLSITSPASGYTMLDGDVVDLVGVATDNEDGDISSKIIWASSIDGALGTGANPQSLSLSLGLHTITATVYDGQFQLPQSLPTIEIRVVAVVELVRDGDVNWDGQLDANDELAVQQHIAGTVPLSPAALVRADLDGDGEVTAADLTILQQAISQGASASTAVLNPSSGELTNSVPFYIAGTATPGTQVRIYLDGQYHKTILADDMTGNFSRGLVFSEGIHEIWVREFDGLLEGPSSAVIAIEYIISSGIPRTGEDQTFEDYDDHYHQAGMQRRFVRDNTTSTVTDRVTGLIWLDNFDTGTLMQTWLSAKSYCQNSTQGGIHNWRLPTRSELMFLVDHNSAYLVGEQTSWIDRENRIDSAFWHKYKQLGGFSVALYRYWTSESWNGNNNPWFVDFQYGNQVIGNSATEGFARCVSGPVTYNSDYDSGDTAGSLLIDKGNELMWQDSPDNATLQVDWQGALNYCEALELDGKTDWRLPNVNEGHTLLQAIRDEELNYTSGDPGNIGQENFWWTSTREAKRSHLYGSGRVWRYYANRVGTQYTHAQQYGSDDQLEWVRCVRDYAAPVGVISTPSQTVGFNESVLLDGAGSVAPDGAIVSYRWRDLTLGQNIGTAVSFAKSDLALGEHEIVLYVTDEYGIETVSEPITILVVTDNPPVADAGPDQTVGFGVSVSLDGTNSYAQEGTLVEYEWAEGSTVLSTLSSFSKSDFTVGAHTVDLTVTDSRGVADIDSVVITVLDAPVADAGGNQVALMGTTVVLDGSGSSALHGTLVSYEWREAGIVLSTESSFNKSDFSIGPHIIDLTVTDSHGGTDTDTVTVTVQNLPVADAGQTQIIEDGDTVTLNASNSMPSVGTIVEYVWRLGGTIIGTGPVISVDGLAAGTHVIELTVTDSQGMQGVSTVIVDVRAVIAMSACAVNHVTDDANVYDIHPDENIAWVGANFSDVGEIETAFNHARRIDASVFQYLQLPSQGVWDAMTASQKGLYLINAERQARGIKPYEGLSPNVEVVAQIYADYTRASNVVALHENDGLTPWQRMDADSVIAANRDGNILPESNYSYENSPTVPVADEQIVRAVYHWIYSDAAPYNTGEPWGHRGHMLQTGLYESGGVDYREGLAGFGISAGAYSPKGGSNLNGVVIVFNTFDPSDTWDHSSTIVVDTDSAQLCEGEVVIDIDPANVPWFWVLKSIRVAPTDVLLAVGGTTSLTVTGVYQNGTTINLTAFADFNPGVGSVVSIDNGAVTGILHGATFVSAQVNGIKSNRVYVQVGTPTDTTNLAGTFGAGYLAHVPGNATIGRYDPQAVSVFNGLVTQRDGTTPLPGVTVSILGHPKYGSVKTDAAGRFVMLAEAGSYRFVYRKEGHLTVHRKIAAASNSWAALEDVVLLPVDSVQTDIDLSNPVAQTHTSSLIADSFGSRSTTLVFSGITSATVTSIDGSQYTIDDLTVRATEYEMPASMPADLPIESAFTYCSELEVVGTRDDDTVTFNNPVVMYIDNFLGFPVGEIVPIGYYDRTLGDWLPSSNGVVVQLLDQNSDGQVDGVDYTGDGLADDINGNGSTLDDVAGIEGFTPGELYWRGSFDHFTPYDANWPETVAGGSEPPGTPDAETGTEDPQDTERVCISSYVKPYQQSFHEEVPIVGTGLALHYSSQRTPGYQHKIRVPVSDSDIPASMTTMTARLDIGGHRFEQSFTAAENVTAEFVWDGKDPAGKRIDGVVTGRVYIGYTYATQYASAGNAASSSQTLDQFPVAWAQPSATGTGVGGRDTFTAWNSSVISVQNSYQSHIATGWSISNYHEKSPDGMVYRGDGGIEEADKGSIVLRTGILDSQSPYDDGYYQKGGSDISYRISDESVLQDRVTGLEWQYINTPVRFRNKNDAINYCATQVTPLGTGWRLPTAKEVAYTLDKASGEHYFPMYRYEALGYWSESTVNTNNSLIPVICVRGDKINDRYIAGLQRDAARQVVVDSQNALMWQDTGANTTIKHTWHGSIDYCEALDHAGFDDWRLPNVNEFGYTLPNGVFVHQTEIPTGVPWSPTYAGRKPYWTSTPNVLDATGQQAWAMESISFTSYKFNKSDQYHVRCVRDDDTALKSPYRFDENGRHIKTIDLDTGNTLVAFNHDVNGELTSIMDQFGNTVTINRTMPGQIDIVSHDGYQTRLTIDAVEKEIDRIDYDDSTFYEFLYVDGALMNQKSDRNGGVFSRLFDAEGRVYQTMDPENGQWGFSAAPQTDGSLIYGYETAENNSYQTVRSILSDGAVQKQTTYADGRVSTNTFLDSVGGATETATSCGITTQLDYVLDDRTLKDIPGTVTVTIPISATGGSLVNSTAITKVYGGDGGADKSSYTVTTTENSNQPGTMLFEARVDETTNRATITSPEGRIAVYDYYADSGLLKSMTPPGGLNTIGYTYDSRGRVETVTSGTRTQSYVYDDAVSKGSVTRAIAANGKETQFSYDAVGRLDVTTLPDLNTINVGYDGNDNVTDVETPRLKNYGFGYSSVGKVESETTPLSETTTYEYDRDRRRKEIVYPSGPAVKRVNTYTDGKLDFVDTPQGQIDYSYGACGSQLTGISESWSGESVTFGHDGHLLTSISYSGSLSQTIVQRYNDELLISSMDYAGHSMPADSIGYDDDGVLTGIHGYTITPKANSPLPETISDGTFNQTRSYNGYGELSGAATSVNGGTAGYTYTLTYNDLGQIDTKAELLPDGTLRNYMYIYDADRGWLKQVQRDDGDCSEFVVIEDYSYDDNGNRSVTGTTATFNAADQITNNGAGTSYTYTPEGHLETRTSGGQTTTYAYSEDGRLLSVTPAAGPAVTYTHNAIGNRVSKSVGGVVQERYLWLDTITLLAVYNADGTLRQRFEHTLGHTPTSFRCVSRYLSPPFSRGVPILAEAPR